MKKTLSIALMTGVMGLAGCVSNQPFTPEQQAIIKQHKIVVRKTSEKTSEQLMVLDKANKAAGEAVSGVVLGLLTGSFGMSSDGDTPRTRLKDDSAGQIIRTQARKASAEKIKTVTPTLYMQEMLANQFQYIEADDKDVANQFVIDIKPVAWQLYYDKFFNGQNTFVLEYAGDITMKLASADMSREFPCDKTSETALSKTDWLANNQLRIRQFAQELAQSCVNKITSELGEPTNKAN